ncbi:SH3 domain-containing protein [Acidicapsa ligni]|uniref:SH3 domain-containing protein n=1 Tax=Acidicapsa ligni TaxID=542300 RepID=UPI0021DFE730|nr:SH3 domain-containing protein [Acidicapsa ligni]
MFLPAIFFLSGCTHFRHITHEYVYVAARQVYLRDRVAAVSNRVALVTNGEALEVVEHGRRFLKVKTSKGQIGWLEEHSVIDDKLYQQFQDLDKNHEKDPVVSTGQLRDELYLHVVPGRETPHFLLIAGSTQVQLLARGTVPRTQGAAPVPAAKPKTASVSSPTGKDQKSPSSQPNAAKPIVAAAPAATDTPAPVTAPAPAPVPMEDWWLVRDKQGHTGWLLANRVDVDIPDEVGAYAEGQRMVGAYPLAKVTDYVSASGIKDESRSRRKSAHKSAGHSSAGHSEDKTDTPDTADALVQKEITEYLTVLTPPRNGLPYDFDQVRVFTWSLNHHRYETAFRLHGIQGYFPIKFSQEMASGVSVPVFSFQIASGADVTIDADTGVARPANPRTIAFRLEGNMVKRTGADQAPIILTHASDNPAKANTAKKKKKR